MDDKTEHDLIKREGGCEQAPSLCGACFNMLSTAQHVESIMSRNGYPFPPLDVLKESAERGCRCCQLWMDIEYAINPRFAHYQASSDSYEVILCASKPKDVLWREPFKHLDLHVINKDRKSLRIPVKVMSLEVNVRHNSKSYADQKAFNLVADNEFAWTRVRQWFAGCAKHPSCAHAVPPLPRLIIYAGVLQQNGSYDETRLVESHGAKARYVALSYCWGGPQRVVTTKANIREHIQGIAWDGLSQTIRDAILVCRKLGFYYLWWVDALCIIQDDETNKLEEIAQMHEVYKNATLTIVAASAESANEGFLRPISLPYCIVPYFPEGKQARQATLSPAVVDSKEAASKWPWSSRFESRDEVILFSPIEKRAWTTQEYLLSPRKLVYGMRSLEWECLHEHQKYSANGFISTYTTNSSRRWGPPILNLFGGPSYKPSIESLLNFWAEFVEDYSSRHLTSAEDKLSAMSAVATEYHRISGCTYAAGLWLESITWDLLWQIDVSNYRLPKARERLPQPQKSPKWRAPSWSWTSVDGLIKSGYRQCPKMTAQILESVSFHSTYPHGRPFGRLSTCYLLAVGPLLGILGLEQEKLNLLQNAELIFDFRETEEEKASETPWGLLCVATMGDLEKEEGKGRHWRLTTGLILEAAEETDTVFEVCWSWRRIGTFNSLTEEAFRGCEIRSIQLV